MQENLVIVESPAKAKTIEKFLGKDFIVKSSFGHIRDLAKKDLGINIGEGYKPVYEIPGDKKKVVDELTKLAKSKTVWSASSCRRCCGRRYVRRCRQAACSRSPCA